MSDEDLRALERLVASDPSDAAAKGALARAKARRGENAPLILWERAILLRVILPANRTSVAVVLNAREIGWLRLERRGGTVRIGATVSVTPLKEWVHSAIVSPNGFAVLGLLCVLERREDRFFLWGWNPLGMMEGVPSARDHVMRPVGDGTVEWIRESEDHE